MKDQYPVGTAFIVLPMDMEYMRAGKLKKDFRYEQQMEMLARMKRKDIYKNIFYPFVFADPRRIAEDENYFKYRISNGKLVIGDCFIKE